jgi:hypothetical protein
LAAIKKDESRSRKWHKKKTGIIDIMRIITFINLNNKKVTCSFRAMPFFTTG